MSTIDYISATWIVLILLAGVLAKRKEITYPTIKNRNHIFILALEVIFLLVTYYFRNQKVSSPYIIIFATFLLAVGWIISYQRLLFSVFRGEKKRPWLWRINILIGGSQHPQSVYFSGDWLQIVAIALLWNSPISLLLSFVIYPLVVFFLTSSNTKDYNKQVTDKSELIKNEVWERFTKTIIKNFGRTLAISLLVIIPIAIMSRDWTIFFGTSDNAINLITTLAQVEATVFALVITFLFVFVEFTNTAYSPRLVRSFTKQWSFRLMVVFTSLSITTKFGLLANVARFIADKSVPSENMFIDSTLFLTGVSVISYFVFIRDVIRFMQPDAIAKQILQKFDSNWMNIVRANWSDKPRQGRLFFSDDDPLVLFERYLATTVERRDIYSTKIALLMLRDRLSLTMNKDDGVIIDEYLFNRIGNIVEILSDTRSDLGLEVFCGVISAITAPSEKVLKDTEVGILSNPPGSQMLMHIAKKAVEVGLLSSGRQAIWRINDRCEGAIKSLPAYSELWLYNPENQNLPTEEAKKMWKNDSQVESVTQGYFSFFVSLGQKAAQNGYPELVWTASHALLSQISKVLEHIENNNFRWRLILSCLSEFEQIVRSACEAKLEKSITFGPLLYSNEEIENDSIGMLMANFAAKYIELLAKARILDWMNVVNVSVMAVNLAKNNPQTTIPILDSLGTAGEIVKQNDDYLKEELQSHLQTEILRRIDQVENAGTVGFKRGYKTKVRKAAINARKRIKQD